MRMNIEEKMRAPYVKTLISLLDTILPAELGDDADHEYMLDDIIDSISCEANHIEELRAADMRISHGVSKIAISCTEWDFVIKIPVRGIFTPVYDDDGERTDEDEFSFLTGAMASDTSDYCMAEQEMYEKACAADVESLFAETAFGGTFSNGNRYYFQTFVRAAVDAGNTPRSSRNSSNIIKSIEKEKLNADLICDNNWLGVAIDYYGEEMVRRFLKFAADYELNDDMHRGNYGYALGTNAPCLLDYSGWYDF